MTRKERKLLEDMYRDLEHPSVEGATYDFDEKTGSVTKTSAGYPTDQVKHMLDADSDYRKGWEKCRVRVYQYLRELGFPAGGR
jgi:hypothetical protein